MEQVAATTRVSPSVARRRGRALNRARREVVCFHLFTLPWLLGFLALSLVPLALGFASSLTDYDGLNLPYLKFMGLRNYARAFQSPDWATSLKNTARYALVTVPVGMALSIMLATMLNRPIRGRDLFRLLYYIPAVLPVAGAVQAWRLLFGQQSGLVNAFLSIFQPGTAINWIRNHFFTVLYLYDWWHIGGGMVLFLAALQGIPVELNEAARLDGANGRQVFFRITLPLITPVIFFQLIMSLLGAMQILDVPILIYGRTGLSGQTNIPQDLFTYMVYIYSQVFDYQRFGYGVALAWIFFVIVLILTLVIVATSRYWVYYEVAQEGEGK